MTVKQNYEGEASVQCDGIKDHDGYNSQYCSSDDEDSPFYYDDSEGDEDDIKRKKKKKSQRQRGEVFNPNTKAEHILFNIANEYSNAVEFRDALRDYIAIQGYDIRMVKSDKKGFRDALAVIAAIGESMLHG